MEIITKHATLLPASGAHLPFSTKVDHFNSNFKKIVPQLHITLHQIKSNTFKINYSHRIYMQYI